MRLSPLRTRTLPCVKYAEDLQAITAYLMDAPHSALRLQRLARIAAT
ncbi:hypothetical protein C4J95_1598 [Pseudomonas orientalis]|nr:hypothetical protein C4J95_1598 [Pseudomonas orientalis]